VGIGKSPARQSLVSTEALLGRYCWHRLTTARKDREDRADRFWLGKRHEHTRIMDIGQARRSILERGYPRAKSNDDRHARAKNRLCEMWANGNAPSGPGKH